ncbi:unnamed protein product, partial [Staurois parvus]
PETRGDQWCAVSLGRRLCNVVSCVQSQLIAWGMYTDDQCSPISATCLCPAMPAVSANQCHLPVPIIATSVPHISAYQCTSMPHISSHLSCLSVSPISASQCHLSIPVSAAYQCSPVLPIS